MSTLLKVAETDGAEPAASEAIAERLLIAGDVRENGGMPSQVDRRPFRVGENLAITPGQVDPGGSGPGRRGC
jgi:hypothetical protein